MLKPKLQEWTTCNMRKTYNFWDSASTVDFHLSCHAAHLNCRGIVFLQFIAFILSQWRLPLFIVLPFERFVHSKCASEVGHEPLGGHLWSMQSAHDELHCMTYAGVLCAYSMVDVCFRLDFARFLGERILPTFSTWICHYLSRLPHYTCRLMILCYSFLLLPSELTAFISSFSLSASFRFFPCQWFAFAIVY